MKKIILSIIIIISICLLKLIITYAANESLIHKYNKGIYRENDGMILYIINYPESYIAYYNNGNILYQNGEYEKAIEEYRTALSMNHPDNKKDCKIRINLVLSMLKTFDLDNLTNEKINSILDILKEAKNILTEKGCAYNGGTKGHSEDANTLKKEIEDLEKTLLEEKQKNSKNQNSNDSQDEENESDQNNQTIEQKLRSFQEQANQEREYKRNNNNLRYDYYEGKSW